MLHVVDCSMPVSEGVEGYFVESRVLKLHGYPLSQLSVDTAEARAELKRR